MGNTESTAFRTIEDGTEYWYNKDNKLHRDNDQPAVIYADGSKFWYQNGKLHRDNDQPAVILYKDVHSNADGTQYWCKNDKLHRDNDLPAIIWSDGDKYWYKNGVRYEP